MVDTHQPDMHGPVKVARGHGFIRAAPEDVLHMLIAIERRPDWDDLCDYGSQVCEKQGVRNCVLLIIFLAPRYHVRACMLPRADGARLCTQSPA